MAAVIGNYSLNILCIQNMEIVKYDIKGRYGTARTSDLK